MLRFFYIIIFVASAASLFLSASVPESVLQTDVQIYQPPTYNVPDTSSTVHLDGVLDEEAWKHAVVLELPFEIDPGENLPARVRTVCRLVAGPNHFYIAFHAYDPEPDQIRAHYMDRDAAWDDDWIFVTLDPFFDQRRGFQFLVNPLGVQMDSLLNEVGKGGAEVDITWDAIWDSAGRIREDGYVVEIAIPYTSLRFPRKEGKQMWGFQAMRHFPRKFAYFFKATPWNRNRDCLLCENAVLIGFAGASPGRNLELNPAITSRRTDAYDNFPEGVMQKGGSKAEVGLSTRWGITPNVHINFAANPDFSQVEADIAQLDINTRFALFFPEKRPFFLEGADLFLTPINAVYSRTLADPSIGFKLTGKAGGHAFGVLTARDDITNMLLPANQGSQLDFLDQGSMSSVIRYRRDVGKRSTLGVLFADRRGGHYFNSILGADSYLQLSASDSLSFNLLYSRTMYPKDFAIEKGQPTDAFDSMALHMEYMHLARNWHWWACYENLGKNFRADVGFVPRTDTRKTTLGIQRVVWGKPDGWYRKLLLSAEWAYVDDQEGRLTDKFLVLNGEINGPLQSILKAGFTAKKELFNHVFFDQEFFQVDLSIRPSGALNLFLSGKMGDAVDYIGSRPARIRRINPGIGCFFGRHIQLRADHLLELLEIDRKRLYTANITQVKIVYQFGMHAFLCAIFQYLDVRRNPMLYLSMVDPTTRSLFTQFLFSYKLNPQTLLFMGYSDNRLGWEGGALIQKDRTFFIKISYAWIY
ncbi:MAG: carbohydrate binding family 9 domain-containing protein [Candidatus Aminicenantes bacterium]|nr:carbohydrate binding family 9 domain-containing protein [Candidatus Aminicenantes bacterium]MDH5742520.1 carbohydrate binding family 9 domain-containing protein [Candidatus Aminicenantes bacterium]